MSKMAAGQSYKTSQLRYVAISARDTGETFSTRYNSSGKQTFPTVYHKVYIITSNRPPFTSFSKREYTFLSPIKIVKILNIVW